MAQYCCCLISVCVLGLEAGNEEYTRRRYGLSVCLCAHLPQSCMNTGQGNF